MRAAVRGLLLALVIVVSGTASLHYANQERGAEAIAAVAASAGTGTDGGGHRFERLDDPPRTVVTTSSGAVLATLTDGSRTVVLTGPVRTFREPRHTQSTITTTAWVRLAPQPWSVGAERADWFAPWLAAVTRDATPDVLAVASQYVAGAPPLRGSGGLTIAGDAKFAVDADFNHYLGVAWRFPDGAHEKADTGHVGALDSAGLVRMVYGYREGYPLQGRDTTGAGLPRSAKAMDDVGPGTRIVADVPERAADYSRLQPGDLLFFASASRPNPRKSRVGIYLGIDDSGHRRVLASRRSADGPTFGDDGGASTLDGPGGYGRAFRSAKRL